MLRWWSVAATECESQKVASVFTNHSMLSNLTSSTSGVTLQNNTSIPEHASTLCYPRGRARDRGPSVARSLAQLIRSPLRLGLLLGALKPSGAWHSTPFIFIGSIVGGKNDSPSNPQISCYTRRHPHKSIKKPLHPPRWKFTVLRDRKNSCMVVM